jgi:hypothetical protein
LVENFARKRQTERPGCKGIGGCGMTSSGSGCRSVTVSLWNSSDFFDFMKYGEFLDRFSNVSFSRRTLLCVVRELQGNEKCLAAREI